MKSIEIIAIQPILPTKNNRQQMFGEHYQETEAMQRIESELRQILEPKVLTLKGFFPTEAALIFSMIAYNLMSIFRLFVLQEKRRKHYLHYDIEPLLLELIFEKVGDTLKLKIALTKKRRKWFVGIWDYPIDLSQKISTAWFGDKKNHKSKAVSYYTLLSLRIQKTNHTQSIVLPCLNKG